jgi:hypothetical protein
LELGRNQFVAVVADRDGDAFIFTIGRELVTMEEHLEAPLNFAGPAHTFSLCRLNDLRDCAHDALEFTEFESELLFPVRCQRVLASAAIAGRCAPLGDDPALDENALERPVKGSLLYLEDVLGSLLDAFRDLVTVGFLPNSESLKNQEV